MCEEALEDTTLNKNESETHDWLFATPWTIQSMEFSKPEY